MNIGMRLRRIGREHEVYPGGPLVIDCIEEPCPHTDADGKETWVFPAIELSYDHGWGTYTDPETRFCSQCGMSAAEAQVIPK